MNDIIYFFEKLGFSYNPQDIEKEYFYMNRFLNDTFQIDAQGNEKQIEIRLIGKKHVKDFKRYDKFKKEGIIQKILEWELNCK